MGIALTGMLTRPMLMLPDQVGWLWMGSMVSSSSANTIEAIKDYDKAIRLEKWALLFVKQGERKYDYAIQAYSEVKRLENWALFSVKQGNYGGAAKAYEEAIRAYDTAI
jgi:tetratricopeptide (TPR) repeat protein